MTNWERWLRWWIAITPVLAIFGTIAYEALIERPCPTRANLAPICWFK